MGRQPGRPRRAERRGHGCSSGGAPPGAGPRRGLGARRAEGAAPGPRPRPSPLLLEERPPRRRSPQVGAVRAPPPARPHVPVAAGRADPRTQWSGTPGPLGAGRAAAGQRRLDPRGAGRGRLCLPARRVRPQRSFRLGGLLVPRSPGAAGGVAPGPGAATERGERCLWCRVPPSRPPSDLRSFESAPLRAPRNRAAG